MKLAAFDLETTGLDGATARILEFCFLELDEDLRELSRWSELVHPQMPIPPETVRIHGITDEMVAGCPPFSEYAARIQALVQDAVLIAHNHKFDLEILSRELVRAGQAGLKPNHPCIDTQRIEAFVNSHSLADTYQRYTGAGFDGAHRSAADTAACVEVLRRQRAAHPAKLPADLEGLLVASLERKRRPDGQERNWLDHGRKFYADAAGTIHYNFGKYRGRPVFESKESKDYLTWMRDKADFPEDVKSLVVSWIGTAMRPLSPPTASGSPAAAQVLPAQPLQPTAALSLPETPARPSPPSPGASPAAPAKPAPAAPAAGSPGSAPPAKAGAGGGTGQAKLP